MPELDPSCAARAHGLSALCDGALPAGEARALEAHAAACPACGVRLAMLRAQAAAVRSVLGARGEAIDLTGFADRVLAAVDRDRLRPRLAERAKVISLEQWSAHRAAFSAAAGVALAASLLFGVFLRAPAPGPAAPPELLAQASVDLLEVEGQVGAVLEAPGQTTVIWVNDEVAQ